MIFNISFSNNFNKQDRFSKNKTHIKLKYYLFVWNFKIISSMKVELSKDRIKFYLFSLILNQRITHKINQIQRNRKIKTLARTKMFINQKTELKNHQK